MLTTDTVPDIAIHIPRHYEGPPSSSNGGWAAGIAAGLLTDPDTPAGVPVEVTLRAPVPINRALTGHRTGERAFLVADDGAVLVEAGELRQRADSNARKAEQARLAADEQAERARRAQEAAAERRRQADELDPDVERDTADSGSRNA